MLVSQHVVFSTLAAVVAAPMVRHKTNLGLFLAAAVGEDVDHYLWYAVTHRDPSLPRAYRFFRSKYGRPPQEHKLDGKRFLHGLAPLAAISFAALGERRLLPVALGVAFHDFLDLVNEQALMPVVYERDRRLARGRPAAETTKEGEPTVVSRSQERSRAFARR